MEWAASPIVFSNSGSLIAYEYYAISQGSSYFSHETFTSKRSPYHNYLLPGLSKRLISSWTASISKNLGLSAGTVEVPYNSA